MADKVYNSALFGQEFPLDLALVDRIEIVRGPARALYGSNAILATVNVITREPAQGLAAGVDGGSNRERSFHGAVDQSLGAAHLLVAGSYY